MKCISLFFIIGIIHGSHQEEVRLLDLEPQDAQQIIEQQDTSLKYAPKIASNVPAVRYLGNEPHHVAEDIYLANQYHGQDGLGGYLYGYSVPDIAKTEKKKAGGDLRGAYNYIAGNGQEIKVEYWDDGTGFHQIDNVPKALPEDLPEVKAAKEEFMRIWQEQAERNSHPVEDPYNSEGQYKEGPLSLQGQKHRQEQFAAQFGKTPNYQQPGYQAAASQQRPTYQSNLENSIHTFNPNYQPYQGKDQQNQGAYQAKQYSSQPNGYSGSAFGSNQGQYKPNQGNLGVNNGNQGQGAGKDGAYGAQGSIAQSGASSSAHAQGSQGTSNYGSGSIGTQGQGSHGYGSTGIGGQSHTGLGNTGSGSTNVGYTSQNQGTSGYGGQSTGSISGYKTQSGFGGTSTGISGFGGQGSGSISGYKSQSGFGGTSTGYSSQGQWKQATTSQGSQTGYQSQYQGQSSPNSNKYGQQSQSHSYDYSGQSSQNQDRYAPRDGEEDDGQYHESEEEQQGPPKGFFYKFDYPVGIIVSKQGSAHDGQQSGGYQEKKQQGVY